MPWNENGGGGWQGGGGPWGQGPSGGGRGGRGSGPGGNQPPDLEELLRRGQERFRQSFPGGGDGGVGWRGILIGLAVLVLIWMGSGFYRVQPDEQGVVLRFGEWIKTTQPGLNYHLPYPIESAMTPKVTRVQRVDVGMRTGEDTRTLRTGAVRDVPEESLMLTGDENIVDIDFSVFWVINDAGAFLFNIQNPELTVKAVAESAMREVVGQSEIEPLLTRGRQEVEQRVQALMQELLDEYQAGVLVTQVQIQKSDPPAAVIDAFRDVQAALADRERLANEAMAYRNKVVPEAQGQARRIEEEAAAYRDQSVEEAEGQGQRFLSIYREYADAKDVTRRRMYLETMERVLRDMNKVIIDSENGGPGVVPYLPLPEIDKRRTSGEEKQ